MTDAVLLSTVIIYSKGGNSSVKSETGNGSVCAMPSDKKQTDKCSYFGSLHSKRAVKNVLDSHQYRWLPPLLVYTFTYSGFPQALEIMGNIENLEKKIHAWINH